MNQAKNLVESRLKVKNITSAERAFLEEMKKNEENSIAFKDPNAKYYNVVLANFIYFFAVSECMKFDNSSPSDASYDQKQIDLASKKQIKDIFDSNDMNFNLQHASAFATNPLSALRSHWKMQ